MLAIGSCGEQAGARVRGAVREHLTGAARETRQRRMMRRLTVAAEVGCQAADSAMQSSEGPDNVGR
jgi:hypothetical protein